MSARPDFAAVAVITFDAAGTLLHPYPTVGDVYQAISLRHGCPHSATELERGFRAAFGRVSKSSIHIAAEERERAYWRQLVDETFAAAGPRLAPDVLTAVFDELWEAFARGEQWRVTPGVMTTLTALRSRGYRLGVLSNWDQRLHRVLHETGLTSMFEHVLISSEVGADKPDIEVFRAAQRAFGAQAGACLHVGDSKTQDFDAALAAGWHAWLVSSGAGTMDATAAQTMWAELLDRLPGSAGTPAAAG